MKITRQQLRQMIQEVEVNPVNPGSRFSSSRQKGDDIIKDQWQEFAAEKLRETYDWFLAEVFPAIEIDPRNLNITTDKDYPFDVFSNNMSADLKAKKLHNSDYIPKGTKINSAYEQIKVDSGLTIFLDDIYKRLALANENRVDGKAYMTSVQPPDEMTKSSKEKVVSEIKMKITRRQLRQIIKEEVNLLEADSNSDRGDKLDPDLLKGAYVSSKEDREAMKDYIANIKAKKKSMDVNDDGELDADELRALADDLEDDSGPNFPPLSHPLISQYADDMRGPTVSDTKVGDAWGDPWYKEYVSYTYSARPNNIQAKQSITLYRLLSDKYFARIYGSYNNRVSHKDPGEFDDPIEAIQAALDSSVVKGTTPAKDLIKKVGEKITGNPTGGAWYD